MGESKTVHAELVTYVFHDLPPHPLPSLRHPTHPIGPPVGKQKAAFFSLLAVPALLLCVVLIILLFDRAKRDDDRCSSKYGKYWNMYREKVPRRIIPVIH